MGSAYQSLCNKTEEVVFVREEIRGGDMIVPDDFSCRKAFVGINRNQMPYVRCLADDGNRCAIYDGLAKKVRAHRELPSWASTK